MHISEGILSAPVLGVGAGLTAAGCAVGLKKMDYKDIPKVAVLSSGFFVASLIHVPLGPTSVHLILNGLVGLLLGWAVFPAILIALFLQAILFQFGGITTLGVNTFNMALPGLVAFYLFSKATRGKNHFKAIVAAFLAGVTGVLFAGIFVAISLVFTGKPFLFLAKTVIFAHVPVMIIEGIVTSFIVVFLRKVKPELLL